MFNVLKYLVYPFKRPHRCEPVGVSSQIASDPGEASQMTHVEHCYIVLIEALEESPLWEVLIRPNSPPPTPEEYKSAAKLALRSVIQDGLVEVFRSQGCNELLPLDTAIQLVASPDAFEVTEDPPELHITKKGRDILFGDCFGISRERATELMFSPPTDSC